MRQFTLLSVRKGVETSRAVITANAVNTLLTRQYIRTLHPLITSGFLALFYILTLPVFRKVQTNGKRIGIGIAILIGLLATSHLLFAIVRFQFVIFPFFMIWILVHAYFAAKEFLAGRIVIGSTGAGDQTRVS